MQITPLSASRLTDLLRPRTQLAADNRKQNTPAESGDADDGNHARLAAACQVALRQIDRLEPLLQPVE